jgi:hypothetical protein
MDTHTAVCEPFQYRFEIREKRPVNGESVTARRERVILSAVTSWNDPAPRGTELCRGLQPTVSRTIVSDSRCGCYLSELVWFVFQPQQVRENVRQYVQHRCHHEHDTQHPGGEGVQKPGGCGDEREQQ